MHTKDFGFAIPFFAVHLFPCYLGVGNMFRLLFVRCRTAYAITDRRLIIRSGFWGASFKSIECDRIVQSDVTVNPFEKMLNRGSIKIYTGATTSRGANVYDYFTGIADPYDVYRLIRPSAGEPHPQPLSEATTPQSLPGLIKPAGAFDWLKRRTR